MNKPLKPPFLASLGVEYPSMVLRVVYTHQGASKGV